MMRYSNLLASKLPATPSTTPPLGQTINMMAKSSSAASSASASSAALATAPLPTAPLPTPAVTLKEQRAFLNQILYLKKGSDQPVAIQALHEEYLASNMDAKKSMVSKWISSGKNVSVLVKEEQNTLQKLEEGWLPQTWTSCREDGHQDWILSQLERVYIYIYIYIYCSFWATFPHHWLNFRLGYFCPLGLGKCCPSCCELLYWGGDPGWDQGNSREVPDAQRVKSPRAPFWSQEHWFAYEEMSKWSRQNTMSASANRESLVSKAGANPMLPELKVTGSDPVKQAASEKRIYESTKRKAAQMYKQLGKIVSDTHMHMIKHPKAKSAPVMAEFTYLEQWILQATQVLEDEEHSWAHRS